jgi:hypothetical protein
VLSLNAQPSGVSWTLVKTASPAASSRDYAGSWDPASYYCSSSEIIGTGVYALIGGVAAEVVGAAWVWFLLAFVIAAITALSYLPSSNTCSPPSWSAACCCRWRQVFNCRRAQRTLPIDEVAPVGA